MGNHCFVSSRPTQPLLHCCHALPNPHRFLPCPPLPAAGLEGGFESNIIIERKLDGERLQLHWCARGHAAAAAAGRFPLAALPRATSDAAGAGGESGASAAGGAARPISAAAAATGPSQARQHPPYSSGGDGGLDQLRIYSRKGVPARDKETALLPVISAALEGVVDEAILDGEVMAWDRVQTVFTAFGFIDKATKQMIQHGKAGIPFLASSSSSAAPSSSGLARWAPPASSLRDHDSLEPFGSLGASLKSASLAGPSYDPSTGQESHLCFMVFDVVWAAGGAVAARHGAAGDITLWKLSERRKLLSALIPRPLPTFLEVLKAETITGGDVAAIRKIVETRFDEAIMR